MSCIVRTAVDDSSAVFSALRLREIAHAAASPAPAGPASSNKVNRKTYGEAFIQ